jgi:hypothetical protein
MDNVDDVYNALLEYEKENNLQDPSAPEEGEDITLTLEELEYLEIEGNKHPLLPEGKIMSESMLNCQNCDKGIQPMHFSVCEFCR